MSLLLSFLQFPRKPAPLTHTHTPNPSPRACSKMSVCNPQGPVEGNQPVSAGANLPSPSLRPTIWCLGGLSVPGEEDKASWLPQPAGHSAASKARMQVQSRDHRPFAPTLRFLLNSVSHMLHFAVVIGVKPQPPTSGRLLAPPPLETAKTSRKRPRAQRHGREHPDGSARTR